MNETELNFSQSEKQLNTGYSKILGAGGDVTGLDCVDSRINIRLGFIDHLGQLIATHRGIPYKEGGKPSGIYDCNQ